jgi:hypothetical protein
VAGQTEEDVAAIIAWWIKCETVFLDSVPPLRKRNRYCQFIGICDMFAHNSTLVPERIINKVGKEKYYTINTFHYTKKNRSTIEFRIAPKEACVSSVDAKNWVRFVLHFVECAIQKGLPKPYRRDDPWTSFLWMDPRDVLEFLKFSKDYQLTPDMEETRDWFLSNLTKNLGQGELSGVWSKEVRKIAQLQLKELLNEFEADRDI